jgi:hypothetical protein
MNKKVFRVITVTIFVLVQTFVILAKSNVDTTFTTLPKAVQDSFQKIAEGAEISSIELEEEIGTTKIYEINAHNGNTQYAYIFLDNGSLLEIEETVDYNVMPDYLKKIVETKYPELEIIKTEAIQVKYFEIKAKENGELKEIKVEFDGSIFSEKDSEEDLD